MAGVGYLTVKVIEGNGLAIKDVGPGQLSDPYCKLQYGVITHTTSTMPQTLNPVWNETYVFVVTNRHKLTVSLDVWDWDRLKSDDFMGYCEICPDSSHVLSGDEQDMELLLQTDAKHVKELVSGTIHVKVSYTNIARGDRVPNIPKKVSYGSIQQGMCNITAYNTSLIPSKWKTRVIEITAEPLLLVRDESSKLVHTVPLLATAVALMPPSSSESFSKACSVIRIKSSDVRANMIAIRGRDEQIILIQFESAAMAEEWRNSFESVLSRDKCYAFVCELEGERPSMCFGLPLVSICTGTKLPEPLASGFDYLSNEEFLCEKGILRLSGDARMIQEIKNALDSGQQIDFNSYNGAPVDLNVVTGLIKLYLRSLPTPLISYELYDIVIAAGHASEELRQSAVTAILGRMDPISLFVLRELMLFCRKIVERSSVNLMGPENVAIVVGPNIVRSEDNDPLEEAQNVHFIAHFFTTLLEIDF